MHHVQPQPCLWRLLQSLHLFYEATAHQLRCEDIPHLAVQADAADE